MAGMITILKLILWCPKSIPKLRMSIIKLHKEQYSNEMVGLSKLCTLNCASENIISAYKIAHS